MLIGAVLTVLSVGAQNSMQLKGRVLDENNNALIGASIVLLPTQKGTVSDENGYYLFNGLKQGKYTVAVSYIGYKDLVDTVLMNADIDRDFHLRSASLSLQEVVVKDNYAETRSREESLNVEVVNDRYLKENMGGSLMQSLERLPGVSSIDIGSGHSKPVIRGLGFNRVVVVENGIKHEGQQWGADHGLEIDQYAADRLEVIKGPASLMFGSDAIGGVIDVEQNRLPEKNSFGGRVDLTGKSNNNLLGSSVTVEGRKEWFYARLQATVLDYGDYKVPADSVDIYSYKVPLHKNQLRNTAGNDYNLHLGFGFLLPRFQSRFYLSNVNSKSGFFANAHGVEPRNVDEELHDSSMRDVLFPYQTVDHLKLINKSKWQLDRIGFETDLGFQRNLRQEKSYYVSHGYMPPTLPDSLGIAPNLEREFDKLIYSGRLKMNYIFTAGTELTLGVNSEYQDNRINGYSFISPAFEQINTGTFLLIKHSFSVKSLVQFGIRYDYGRVNSKEYNDWFQSPVGESSEDEEYLQRAQKLDRSFSNVTWSVGYNYNPENWSLKANIGKSFRMPIAKELAANGVNYHHFSYEVGSPELDAEISYQIDAGVEYHSKKFAVGATPFVNYFPNYIFLNPTSEHDRLYGNGNQVYNYVQSEVFRFGGEVHAHYQLSPNLQMGVLGEYVYSEQISGEKKGFTLPFSPPASATLNLKYRKPKLMVLNDAYVSLDYRLTAAQNKIVPPEEQTDGYQVANISFGGNVNAGRQKLEISMQVQNLLNSKYFNHTSYYRQINIPEAGKNFVLNVSIPF